MPKVEVAALDDAVGVGSEKPILVLVYGYFNLDGAEIRPTY